MNNTIFVHHFNATAYVRRTHELMYPDLRLGIGSLTPICCHQGFHGSLLARDALGYFEDDWVGKPNAIYWNPRILHGRLDLSNSDKIAGQQCWWPYGAFEIGEVMRSFMLAKGLSVYHDVYSNAVGLSGVLQFHDDWNTEFEEALWAYSNFDRSIVAEYMLR